MAKVTDHTLLADGTEFTTDPASETLTLTATGDLAGAGGESGGVTGVALFSAQEDAWRNGANHWKYRFPHYFVTGELGNSWEMRGGTVITSGDEKFIRDCGIRYRSGFGSDATVTQEYVCLVGNGSIASGTNQAYVLLDTDTAPQNLTYTGLPNELVKVYDSAGDDDRGSLVVYLREWGNTFIYYDLNTEQSVSTLLPVSYLIPMETVLETNGSATNGAMQTEAYIAANTPYTGMGPSGNQSDLFETLAGSGFTAWANSTVYAANSVVSDGGRWYITTLGGTSNGTGVGDDTGVTDWAAYSGERDVDGTYYAYQYIMDANSGTVNQFYEHHQYMLRQTSDVDAGATSQRGDTMEPAVSWVNGKLRTRTGFYIDNIATADASNVEQTDVSGTQRTVTFVPTFTVNVVDADGNAANAPTGARLRIHDVTNANTLHNDTTITGSSSLGVSYSASGSATIKVEWNALNGTTNRSLHKETTTTMTDSADKSISILFEDDTIYVANAVDGSAVTGLSINGNKIDVDANVASNTLTWQQIYAWYCYYANTSAGIADSDFLISAKTQVIYEVDPSLEIKNNNTGNPLIITGANVADTNGSVAGWVDTSGENIYIIPEWVEAFSSGSALTGTEKIQLATAAARPSATQIVDEMETQMQADPTGFQVNIKEINDAAVAGSGTSEDKWR